MRTLFLDYIPQDLQALKEVDPANLHVVGGGIYAYDVVHALLKYSTIERIVFLDSVRPTNGDIRDLSLLTENKSRVSFIAEHEVSFFRNSGDTLFFATGSRLPSLERLRRASGRSDIPIVGAIHTISFRSYLGFVYRLLSLPLAPFDALICSTKAGKTAIENYVDEARFRVNQHGTLDDLATSLRLPIIPLGVDMEEFVPRPKGESKREVVILSFGRLSRNTKARPVSTDTHVQASST